MAAANKFQSLSTFLRYQLSDICTELLLELSVSSGSFNYQSLLYKKITLWTVFEENFVANHLPEPTTGG